MKTDKEIFDNYCHLSGIGPINMYYYIKQIENTYQFQCYKIKIKFNEFIESIVKELKLDKILNKFKDK